MTLTVPCLFGLESLVADEMRRLNLGGVRAENGRVHCEGTMADIARLNINLRCGARVLMELGSFPAPDFESLFQGVAALPWEDFIPSDGEFPVKGYSLNSKLHSVPACQAIVKKAAAQRLGRAYGRETLPETGRRYQIQFAIIKDTAALYLDTSGEGLYKRGYRAQNLGAPLRETLAAALVLQSGWHPWQPLYDPCCGTGTILIEAAFIALNRAPGLTRRFAMESWPCAPFEQLEEIRREARLKFEEGGKRALNVSGSDINPEAIELARRHVKQAGLEGRIQLAVKDMRDVTLAGEPGVFIANPPYGERLDNIRAAHAVARQLGALQKRCPGWKLCAFSADMGFEREYGRRATRRRRYYNGRIECEYRIFE